MKQLTQALIISSLCIMTTSAFSITSNKPVPTMKQCEIAFVKIPKELAITITSRATENTYDYSPITVHLRGQGTANAVIVPCDQSYSVTMGSHHIFVPKGLLEYQTEAGYMKYPGKTAGIVWDYFSHEPRLMDWNPAS